MISKGEEQRAHLIMKLRGQGIRSASVLSAIESVPRDIFIENALKNRMFFGTSIWKAFWVDFGRVFGGQNP